MLDGRLRLDLARWYPGLAANDSDLRLGAGPQTFDRSRRKLLADVVARQAAEPFADLTWQQFEQVIGEMFRKQGSDDLIS